MTGLLRYSLHTIKFTPFMYIVLAMKNVFSCTNNTTLHNQDYPQKSSFTFIVINVYPPPLLPAPSDHWFFFYCYKDFLYRLHIDIRRDLYKMLTLFLFQMRLKWEKPWNFPLKKKNQPNCTFPISSSFSRWRELNSPVQQNSL